MKDTILDKIIKFFPKNGNLWLNHWGEKDSYGLEFIINDESIEMSITKEESDYLVKTYDMSVWEC